MAQVVTREAARRELIDHFVFLAENAGLPLADSFLNGAETIFEDLASSDWWSMLGMTG